MEARPLGRVTRSASGVSPVEQAAARRPRRLSLCRPAPIWCEPDDKSRAKALNRYFSGFAVINDILHENNVVRLAGHKPTEK